MPTAYTHSVQTGETTELAEFAWTCSRAMMALVEMRDERFDAPIPERFEPNTKYHDERLADLRAKLADITKLSLAECAARAEQEHAAAAVRDQEREAQRQIERDRYAAMIAKVEAWDCRAEGLKPFMLEQLNQSLNFDCGGEPYREAGGAPKSGGDWLEQQVKELSRAIGYQEESRAKTIAVTETRNRWLADLRASLSPQTKAA